MRDELYCTPSSRIVNIDYETPMDHKVNPNFQFQLCINLSDEEMFFRGFSHRSAMNNLWRHSKNYLPKGRSGQERNDWNCDILCELLLSSSFGTNKSGLCQCYQQNYLCLHFCIYLWLQVDIWKVFSEVLTCPLAWFWSYIFPVGTEFVHRHTTFLFPRQQLHSDVLFASCMLYLFLWMMNHSICL